MALILCPGCALPRTASDASAECPVCGYKPVATAAPDDDDASALVLGPDIEPVSARPRSVASAKIHKAAIGGAKPTVSTAAHIGPVRLAPPSAAVLDQMPPAPVSAQVYMATAPVTAKIRRTSAPVPQLTDEPVSLSVAASPLLAPPPNAPVRTPDFAPAPVATVGHPHSPYQHQPHHPQPMVIPVPVAASPMPWVLAGLGLGAAAVAVVGWYLALAGATPTPAPPAPAPERVVVRDSDPKPPAQPVLPPEFDPNAREVLPHPRVVLPSGEVADGRE